MGERGEGYRCGMGRSGEWEEDEGQGGDTSLVPGKGYLPGSYLHLHDMKAWQNTALFSSTVRFVVHSSFNNFS